MRTKTVKSITIEPALWEDLKRLARIERRTVSSMAELIIERYVITHCSAAQEGERDGKN